MPTFSLVMLVSAFARADVVYLQGGRVLEGNATVDGDKVIVELESGRVTFERTDVVRIDEAKSALDEARSREKKLANGDVAGMLELADFCRDHDLPARERALLERIVAREPNHAEARRRLGYVREGDVWVLRTEQVRKEQLAQRARREEELEHKRQQLALEEASLERDRAEAELKRARSELAQQRATQPAPSYPLNYPSWYSPYAVPSTYGWNHRSALNQGPWTMPGPSPSNSNYIINGVRSPASYIDDAQRAARSGLPPR
ncbi:MAG TPA: hypothetical protein VI299_11020 [Polyangiales bacterium]